MTLWLSFCGNKVVVLGRCSNILWMSWIFLRMRITNVSFLNFRHNFQISLYWHGLLPYHSTTNCQSILIFQPYT